MIEPAPLVARTDRRRRRWRRLHGLVSGSVGALALGTAVYLGVTAPATSPVQAAAPAQAAQAAPAAPAAGGTQAQTANGAGTAADPDRGGRDDGGRVGQVRAGRGHR